MDISTPLKRYTMDATRLTCDWLIRHRLDSSFTCDWLFLIHDKRNVANLLFVVFSAVRDSRVVGKTCVPRLRLAACQEERSPHSGGFLRIFTITYQPRCAGCSLALAR
jgi:hypothetical protein